MTSKDLMPFGKHKGKPMGEVDRSYFDWLMKQDGFADKNKEMARWIREGDAAAPAIEQKNNEEESELFRRAPEPFKHWWTIAYGDRLRKQGAHNYIPFMRVALEAWLQATGVQLAAQKPAPPPPIPPATAVPTSEEVHF